MDGGDMVLLIIVRGYEWRRIVGIGKARGGRGAWSFDVDNGCR
jgi:hypothetical protein